MSLLDILTPAAHAATTTATAAGSPQPSSMPFFIMMGALVLFMYFLAWRPQSKRAKEQRNLLASLAEGDEIVTVGGILGTIRKINDNYITLSVDGDVTMPCQKSAITGILPKGTLKSI